jgi:hypothetical protein
MKDTISKKIQEKLLPTIKNFQDGNVSEHDIFPSLLWLLLENSKELEQKTEITKNDLLRQIEKLKPIFQENISTIVTQENKKTLLFLNEQEQKDVITKNDLLRKIEELKPIFQENISTIVTQENKKTLLFLKWLIGFCIFQLIGLGALAAIILTR